jgi:hypothetical protein
MRANQLEKFGRSEVDGEEMEDDILAILKGSNV